MKHNINGYELSRQWFDYCFNNPERIKPNHTALYFFCIEHCNRLGWKEKFGLPTTMAKEAIGIHSYNTYIKTVKDLVSFGFIKLIQKSKNQYSSNIIALTYFDKALDKAFDKALIKHGTKQSESTEQSIDSIIKQLTINKEQLTKKNIKELNNLVSILDDNVNEYSKEAIDDIYNSYPSKCPVKGNSTGKSHKNKEKIKSLLKHHPAEHLKKIIPLYVEDCRKTNTFIKNFSTFLNNIPDIEQFVAEKKHVNVYKSQSGLKQL